MSLFSNPLYTDFRTLANKDIRHKKLKFIPDIWYDNFTVLVEYDTEGNPLTGVVLRDYICPIDPNADFQIRCWVADLTKTEEVLEPAYKKIVEGIRQEMIKQGKTKVFGLVPKYSVHLTKFLDKVSTASKCEKVDGTDILAVNEDENIAMDEYVYYIGFRDAVADFTDTIITITPTPT